MKLFHRVPIYWLYIDLVFASQPSIDKVIAPPPSSSYQPTSTALQPRPRPSQLSDKNGTGRRVAYHQSCGLSVPSLEDWNNGTNKEVKAWLKTQYQLYFDDDRYDTFPQYMRDNFASSVTPFALECNGLNHCNIGSCLEINQNSSTHDRQMAYYVFESISGIDATYHMLDDSTTKSFGRILARADELVTEFTYAYQEKKKAMEKEHARKLGLAIGVALALVAGAIAAGLGPLVEAVAVITIATETIDTIGAYTTIIANTYIAANSMVGGIVESSNDPVKTATETFRHTFNTVSERFENLILNQIQNYATGQLVGNLNMELLIETGLFVEPDIFRREAIHAIVTSFVFASAINALWRETGDHPYIVHTNALNGNCTSDMRGPTPNRVCLPERPESSFWLYYLVGKHTHNRSVKGPPGFRKLLKDPESYYGITVEDIVRSSLWVHENNYEEKFVKIEPDFLDFMKAAGNKIPNRMNAGKVPGAFTLPICRTPGGEAISAIWEHKLSFMQSGPRYTNYPCSCGPDSWRDAKPGTDEMKKFLLKSGLIFSEDYNYVCDSSRWQHCKDHHSQRWKWDPQPPENRKIYLESQYTKCRANPHDEMGDLAADLTRKGAW